MRKLTEQDEIKRPRTIKLTDKSWEKFAKLKKRDKQWELVINELMDLIQAIKNL